MLAQTDQGAGVAGDFGLFTVQVSEVVLYAVGAILVR